MKIKEFIQTQVLRPRLKQHEVLVVYDPDKRYHQLCLELATEKFQVIDASESSITSRAAALSTLQKLGLPSPDIEGILVYVPTTPPLTDEERQRDPFAIYGACGAVFPSGDGDEYRSLCLKARADHTTEIRGIFNADPNPGFEVIDAVGGGAGWPNLQARLGVESARDLLFVLLTPSPAQLEALKGGAAGQEAWAAEVRALCQSTLALKILTRSSSWGALADELWRYLLFSEFVFDLPVDLPDLLGNVPRAPAEARLLVEDLCDRLRNDQRTQALYIDRAESVEKELNLQDACQAIEDLGARDTFPFEERSFYAQAVEALQCDEVDKLRQVLQRHTQSVWIGRGENQVQWALLQAAAGLVQACEDADRQLTERQIINHNRGMETLVDLYIRSVREADRLQREFEQAVGDTLGFEGETESVIRQARLTYRKLADKLQGLFVRNLEKSGWPVLGKLSNADAFDQVVAPKLTESGRRVALFLIDAMRYELGVELAKQLNEEGQVEIQAACAQLPTITPVGMASLLPGAGQTLQLREKDGKALVELDGQSLTSAAQRMEILRKRYGQRFAEVDLAKFLPEKRKLDSTVEILVLRSNEMDSDFENNPEAAPGLISRTFRRVRSAIHKLREIGFQEAVILTDHGFFLNTAIEAGDVCSKPPGKWVNLHERILLGDGASDANNLVMSSESLGIRGDFSQVALPKAMVAYRAGLSYFHGGASLQEALVPVISIRIRVPEKKVETPLSVLLNYKRGGKRITTRLPVIEVSLTGQSSLFSGEQAIEIILEAHGPRGKVVGEAKPGGAVNPATRTIHVKPGEILQVTMKMDLDYEGKFSIKALDPSTLAALGSSLDLETDYTV